MATTWTARELLDRLVSFPTVSRELNLDCVDFVEDYLAGIGARTVRVPSPDGTKAAIYAQVGPDAPGGVVLSGHTDVVPVDGQAWTTDPFTVTERDGRLYGRGTCDMKGFDALALWAMGQAAHRRLTRPLQIALSYDEEIGLLGAPVMIDHMVSHAMTRAEAVIVGEPSMMKVVTGHKGGIRFDVRVKGFEVHSSLLPEGVSAVMWAARLIDWANRQNEEIASRVPEPQAALYRPPFTTLHVGTIEGGTAGNITAANCRFGMEIRVVPGEAVADWAAAFEAEVARLEARMKAIRPEAGITATRSSGAPPLVPEADGPAERLARAMTGDNATNVVSYGTEAGQFQERGYSACVCGPGDIAQAHQPDEFLEVAQFEAGQGFMTRLLAHLSE